MYNSRIPLRYLTGNWVRKRCYTIGQNIRYSSDISYNPINTATNIVLNDGHTSVNNTPSHKQIHHQYDQLQQLHHTIQQRKNSVVKSDKIIRLQATQICTTLLQHNTRLSSDICNTIVSCASIVGNDSIVVTLYNKQLCQYDTTTLLTPNNILTLIRVLCKQNLPVDELHTICANALISYPYSTRIYNAMLTICVQYNLYDQGKQTFQHMLQSQQLSDPTQHIECNHTTYTLINTIGARSNDYALLIQLYVSEHPIAGLSKATAKQAKFFYQLKHDVEHTNDPIYDNIILIDQLTRSTDLPALLWYYVMLYNVQQKRIHHIQYMWRTLDTNDLPLIERGQWIEVIKHTLSLITGTDNTELFNIIFKICQQYKLLDHIHVCNALIKAAIDCHQIDTVHTLLHHAVTNSIKIQQNTIKYLLHLRITNTQLINILNVLSIDNVLKGQMLVVKSAHDNDWNSVYHQINRIPDTITSQTYSELLTICAQQHNLIDIEIIQNLMEQYNMPLLVQDYNTLINLYANAGDTEHKQYAIHVYTAAMEVGYQIEIGAVRNVVHCYAQFDMYKSAISVLQSTTVPTQTPVADLQQYAWLICDTIYSCLKASQLDTALQVYYQYIDQLKQYSATQDNNTVTPVYLCYFMLLDACIISGQALTDQRRTGSSKYNLTSLDALRAILNTGITMYKDTIRSVSFNQFANDTTQMSTQHIQIARNLLHNGAMTDSNLVSNNALYDKPKQPLTNQQYTQFLTLFSNEMERMRNHINNTEPYKRPAYSTALLTSVKRLIAG